MQPENRVQSVQDPPQISPVFEPRPFGRQLTQMPSEDSSHVSDLKVRPAHRSSRIVTTDQLCHDRVDRGVLRIVVRQDLLHKKRMNMLNLQMRRHCWQDIRLSKLTLPQLQEFFNEKLKAGNSPALVRYLRVVLRAALNHALKADLIARNVAELATPPKVEKREITPFTSEQAGRFLKAAIGHRLEALFTVGLAIGMRSGECSALKWEDVDLRIGVLTVKHTLQRLKGKGLALMPPKSQKSRRTIQLPASCVAGLKAHRKRQEQECELAGSDWQETGHVFTSSIGTPIDDRKILKEFNCLVEAAKLPKQRFHDLRHACISLLGAQGVPLKVIAEIVGIPA